MTTGDSASTFAKGLQVLDCFEGGRRDLTMADVARMTGFDRATARRLCLTLLECGYLTKQDRALILTPKVVAIAGGYLSAHDFGKAVQPILNQFAQVLQGEIAMAVIEGARAVYVARSSIAEARLSLGFSVGSVLPLLPTSVGRMLLAQMPQVRREELLSQCTPERFTEATEMDVERIREDIGRAAAQGYCFVSNEFETGAAGVAVPVGPVGDAMAVLGTSGTVNHFKDAQALEPVVDTLRQAAMNLRR